MRHWSDLTLTGQLIGKPRRSHASAVAAGVPGGLGGSLRTTLLLHWLPSGEPIWSLFSMVTHTIDALLGGVHGCRHWRADTCLRQRQPLVSVWQSLDVIAVAVNGGARRPLLNTAAAADGMQRIHEAIRKAAASAARRQVVNVHVSTAAWSRLSVAPFSTTGRTCRDITVIRAGDADPQLRPDRQVCKQEGSGGDLLPHAQSQGERPHTDTAACETFVSTSDQAS